MTRRVVRTTAAFVDAVYAQLPDERTDELPSAFDFLSYYLGEILERFATGWDDLPEHIAGRGHERELLTFHGLGLSVAVLGRLGRDGGQDVIELLDIEIEAPWHDESWVDPGDPS